jgi:hypothetical protein
MATLSKLESQARDLIEESIQGDTDDAGWNSRQAVRVVFLAMWGSSLPIERIGAIAQAILNQITPQYALLKAVAELMRENILRVRVDDGGQTLFELNLMD